MKIERTKAAFALTDDASCLRIRDPTMLTLIGQTRFQHGKSVNVDGESQKSLGQVARRRETSFMNQQQNLGFWSADYDSYEEYLYDMVGSPADFERDELLEQISEIQTQEEQHL